MTGSHRQYKYVKMEALFDIVVFVNKLTVIGYRKVS